jgi:site-specific DNA recombinase
MRVAFYARVSTDKQAEKYGIPSQVEALRKRCLERGWIPVLDGDKDAFIDDGYSGAELDRPALNRLRQAAREGRVDVVLSYDPDRLSRKLYHQMILAEEFEKQGIKLEFVTQDMGTSPEDRMFFNMRGLVAEYEREKIRERTIRGSREKARLGRVVNAGVSPFGFLYNKEKATLEEDPEKAQTLRLIFYTFANENLSLQRLADRLNRLHIPTPKGGDRWRASTLGIMLRNEVYIGRMHQFRQYHIEPRLRRQPSTRNRKTSHVLRPKEEWITVEVPPLVPIELFEDVQRKLKRNADLSRRNTKREYLLSGILYCSQCGGRMGGHAIHDISYYRCYRKDNPDRVPLGLDGKPQPCSCPEVKAEIVEPAVWDTICQLIRYPDFLIQELHKRNTDNSQTKEILERELQLCQARLKAMPDEQRRLVEGYRKGLYADFMMREDMELIQKEQGELEKRKSELERQLTQRKLTESQETRIRSFTEKISSGLDTLDFAGRQELMRLLIEKVLFDGQVVEIQTIINPDEQLHPVHRGGLRGRVTLQNKNYYR